MLTWACHPLTTEGLFTCRDLLAVNQYELVDRLDLYLPDVRAIVQKVHDVPPPAQAPAVAANHRP
jgi:hypothetical protein